MATARLKVQGANVSSGANVSKEIPLSQEMAEEVSIQYGAFATDGATASFGQIQVDVSNDRVQWSQQTLTKRDLTTAVVLDEGIRGLVAGFATNGAKYARVKMNTAAGDAEIIANTRIVGGG